MELANLGVETERLMALSTLKIETSKSPVVGMHSCPSGWWTKRYARCSVGGVIGQWKRHGYWRLKQQQGCCHYSKDEPDFVHAIPLQYAVPTTLFADCARLFNPPGCHHLWDRRLRRGGAALAADCRWKAPTNPNSTLSGDSHRTPKLQWFLVKCYWGIVLPTRIALCRISTDHTWLACCCEGDNAKLDTSFSEFLEVAS